MKQLMIAILAGVMGTCLVACGEQGQKMDTEVAAGTETSTTAESTKPAAAVVEEAPAPAATTTEEQPAATESTPASEAK